MGEINDGGPAFPCEQGSCPDGTWNQTFEPGMSLRDYFAAAALPAIIARAYQGLDAVGATVDNVYEIAAKESDEIADAMIAARKTSTGAA